MVLHLKVCEVNHRPISTNTSLAGPLGHAFIFRFLSSQNDGNHVIWDGINGLSMSFGMEWMSR